HGLATELAYAAGLRAHELLTLRRGEERAADPRPALASKWQGRNGVIYTVHGKGGLVREVLLPHALAERLEAVRLDAPLAITDRGIHYQSHYDIGGGQRWSNSVSAASERALGWSTGAHGLRHSYAQERMAELQASLSSDAALTTVSQEMGHFRPEITETYLR
ncbi:site-specific integrase, partial [Aeromonas veronii]